MKYLLSLILIIPASAFANYSYIPKARTLVEGGSEIGVGVSYFQTTSIITDTGEGASLGNGLSYRHLDVDFSGKYGFTSQLEGNVGLRGRLIQATDNFQDEDVSYNQSGAESFKVGFKFSFEEQAKMKYALEGWYRSALFEAKKFSSLTEAPSDVSLGDDNRELAFGLLTYVRTEANNFANARVYYRDPGQHLSTEIFSEVEYAMMWEYLTFAVGVENVYSLENDEYTNDPENKPIIYSGPTNQFNSVNRAWTAPYAHMNLSFGGAWRLEGRYTQVITGNSTDLGPRISAHFIRRSEKASEYSKRDASFKEYQIEGLVTKVSSSRNACIIDKGLSDGITKGMKIDFYFFDYIDGNTLIAKGNVLKVKAGQSLVQIQERYTRKRVEAGIVARAGLISQ